MFAKLLKHEWRRSVGTMGILGLAIVGVGILGGVILRTLTEFSADLNEAAYVGITLSLVFMGLAMVGCAAAMELILLYRFYKSKFTDEGYLTFTLPVNSHQIFLSSGLNILIWSLISGVVLFLGAVLFYGIGTAGYEYSALLSTDEWRQVLEELAPSAGYTATLILQGLIAPFYSVVIALSCITVGSVAAKKHKILAAFGIYYGISYLTSIITSTLTVLLSLNETMLQASGMDYIYDASAQTMALTIVWELLLMVGGYFLSTHLMKKKLNLP